MKETIVDIHCNIFYIYLIFFYENLNIFPPIILFKNTFNYVLHMFEVKVQIFLKIYAQLIKFPSYYYNDFFGKIPQQC